MAFTVEGFNPPLLYYCCSCGVLVDVRDGGQAHTAFAGDGHFHMLCTPCFGSLSADLQAKGIHPEYHDMAIDLPPVVLSRGARRRAARRDPDQSRQAGPLRARSCSKVARKSRR